MTAATGSNLQEILKILHAMVQAELAVSELYRACDALWKEDGPFWAGLQKQEVQHAQNIRKMMEIVSRKADRFTQNPSFNLTAVEHFTAYVKEVTEKLRKRSLNKKEALFILRDIEQSVIESHYQDVVKTDDAEYRTLAKQIAWETYEHRSALDRKIAQTSK